MMSDHQDSEHFMGVRSEDELYAKKGAGLGRVERIMHMRNYKALEGVVKTLRWALGDKSVEHPLE